MATYREKQRGEPDLGNGAREAVLRWLQGPPVANPVEEGAAEFQEVSADNLIAHLWVEGFKIVPLQRGDCDG